jgi:hypothetical protein
MKRKTNYTYSKEGCRRAGKVKHEPLPFDKAFLRLERVLAALNGAGGRLILLFFLFLICAAAVASGVPDAKLGALPALYTLLGVLRRTNPPCPSRTAAAALGLVKNFLRARARMSNRRASEDSARLNQESDP